MSLVAAYGSSGEEEEDEQSPPAGAVTGGAAAAKSTKAPSGAGAGASAWGGAGAAAAAAAAPLPPPSFSLAVVCSNPPVQPQFGTQEARRLDPLTKEVFYNPTVDELYAPKIGPENPFQSAREKAVKNMFTGYVEPAEVDEFHFEDMRRTYHTLGYAMDPSMDAPTRVIGDAAKAAANQGNTLATKPKPREKRPRQGAGDAADLEGFQGPWAAFHDEKRTAAPSAEEMAQLEAWRPAMESKRKARARLEKEQEDKGEEHNESSTLHVDSLEDYLGRTYISPPSDLKPEAPARCFLPKKTIHTWAGHPKGVAAIRFLPVSAHLLLSAGMDGKVKIWEVYGRRRLMRTFNGHTQGVRDICFNDDGHRFLSAGYDRFVRFWDTETGECVRRFTNRKVPYCVKFHPSEENKHIFVTGTSDKKIIAWDTRTGDVVQEYDRHLGAVNTVNFIDNGARIVSTSDDKSIRVWEWNVPVDTKHIAEPGMHALPTAALHPSKKWIIFQSLDNSIVTYTAGDRFRAQKKKTFKGHLVSAYAIQIGFSPCGSYVLSGDADGHFCIWDWKTAKMYSKLKAHEGACVDVQWNPNEASRVATCGWDGSIKYWD